jgi:voltage-gated potassium channel
MQGGTDESRIRKLIKEKGWRGAIAVILASWGHSHLGRISIAILVIWIAGGTALYLAERGNPAFGTWGESLWSVWVALFSGMNDRPETFAGRAVAVIVIVSGVALAGLFTANVASILIERTLRSREIMSLEMSDHLVLCSWSPRALEWIREVHSAIVADKRPVVVIHENPDEVELPDRRDDPALNDVYIVKGDPANEVILKRARVPVAHSVVILADDRQGPHADGKTIVSCIAVKNVCRGEQQPNVIVECRDPKYRAHMRKAGADEIISAAEFGLRLLARAALFHGMTRVYQELLTVGRDANEMYLVPVSSGLIGRPFVEAAAEFLKDRNDRNAAMLIGVYRGEKMMLNPVGNEAGPLREGDELILLCPVLPDLSGFEGETSKDQEE